MAEPTNAERARAFAEEAARNYRGEETYLLDQAKVYAQLAVADAIDRQTAAILEHADEMNKALESLNVHGTISVERAQ